MAFRVRMRKNINIGRVVSLIIGAVLTLYVGGELLTSVGTTMLNTCSQFYNGLTLIGWTVNSSNCISSTTTSTGLLTVVGLIAIAGIVMQFVKFKL